MLSNPFLDTKTATALKGILLKLSHFAYITHEYHHQGNVQHFS